MAQIGYDHKDSGETLYMKYPIKKYPLLIKKITGQEGINKPLIIKLDHTKSPYSLKYGAKFQNIFYRNSVHMKKNVKPRNFIPFDVLQKFIPCVRLEI